MVEYTDVLTGIKARKKILEGVNLCYDTAKLTLGPEGKNAILPRTFNRGPRITNDGITILELAKMNKDDHVRLSAEAFMEGSKRTNMVAGDGTTGTAVVSGFLVNQNFNNLAEQDIPIAQLAGQVSTVKGVRALRQEMKEAKDLVITEVKKKAKKIETLEELEMIATISIGKEDEKVAKTVAKLVWEIGRDANGNFIDNHIDVTEGYKGEIETEVIKGMRFPAKVAHRAFVNKPEHFEMVAEDTAILITNYKLDNPFQIIGIIDRCKTPKISIFAPDFSGPVIQSLAATTKNGLFCYPVKCPALRTEQLQDLAAYTGATVIDKDTGKKLESVTVNDLGKAQKIIVKDTENKEDAILIGGKGEILNEVTERCKVLKGQIKESRNELTTISLERRIANLQSAVGIIRVGATTNSEALFLKLKIEDGVYACKGALEEGYVKGGGICLKEIAEELPKNILTDAIKAPYEQIQKNAGGYFEIAEDVIDPAKVVRLIVEHGVSVASSLITCEISIPESREKTEYDGLELLARVVAKSAYYDAKHMGMLQESQDEMDKDMRQKFEEVMMEDK